MNGKMYRSVICWLFLVICLSWFACSNGSRFPPISVEQKNSSEKVLPSHLKQEVIIKRLKGFREQIETNLPFRKVLWEAVLPKEKIRTVTLLNELLCIETNTNRLYAIRTDSGLRQWQNQFNAPLDFEISEVEGLPQQLTELNDRISMGRENLETELGQRPHDLVKIETIKREIGAAREMIKVLRDYDRLYFTIRGEIVCLDRLSGNILWKKRLTFVPRTTPTAVKRSVFIGALDWNRVYQFDSINHYERNWFRTDDLVSGRSVCVPPSLYFASSSGRIYSYDIETGDKKWEYEVQGRIKGELLLDEDTFYIGSSDFALYALDRHIGKILWKFESGAPIRTQPTLVKTLKRGTDTETDKYTERSLYFRAENDALYALELVEISVSNRRGDDIILKQYKLKWKFPMGKRLVAKIGRRSYVLGTDNKTLYELDDTSGTLKGQYSLSGFVFCLSEPDFASGIVYLATSDGYIFAVQGEE